MNQHFFRVYKNQWRDAYNSGKQEQKPTIINREHIVSIQPMRWGEVDKSGEKFAVVTIETTTQTFGATIYEHMDLYPVVKEQLQK